MYATFIEVSKKEMKTHLMRQAGAHLMVRATNRETRRMVQDLRRRLIGVDELLVDVTERVFSDLTHDYKA